jgi:Cu(I)/Ag(I) efflux system membrane fusion protein
MNKWLIMVIVVVIAGGAVLSGLFLNGQDSMSRGSMPGSEQQPLYWVAPMDPNYRRDEPGLSPMGMELIPVFEGQQEGGTVQVSAAIQQNLGLRTATVQRMNLSREVTTVGYTRWDESSIQMLHPRAEGWLEVFTLASVGDQVKQGQVIYELFAPTLVSAQREYLTARQSDNSSLASLARERLVALGFSDEQIRQLDINGETSSRLVYRADRDAIVTAIGARAGNFVAPATHIATLASLDTVWLDVETFESDAGAMTAGLDAEVIFPAFPGEVFPGQVAYVYPALDVDSRTLKARLVMDNADHRIKANMFASVRIKAAPAPGTLVVPREAVILSRAGARVIRSLGEGRFQPQVVTTGISSGGMTEILDGLSEGDVVVSSGQFLLDAEANGEQAFSRLLGAAESTGNMDGMENMEGMEMPGMASEESGSYTATGTITRLGAGGMVTINHGPVSELEWPSMTMGFDVAPEVSLDEFSVNDAVSFAFEQGEDGMYRVTRMELQEQVP